MRFAPDKQWDFSQGIPEASTWAMLVTGFGALGFAAFRRAQEAFERIVTGREPEKLPPVLSPEEIARFLEAVAGLYDRMSRINV